MATLNKTSFLTILFLAAFCVSIIFFVIFLQEKQVKGAVIDANTGMPISTATLEIGSTQTTTNKQGHFKTYLQQNRNISLQASAPGYLPATFSFDLPWYLKSGNLDVELAPMGLPIQVTDAWNGNALAQVSVQVEGFMVTTNLNGMAHLPLDNLTPPTQITIYRPGYVPHHFELSRLPSNSHELPVHVTLEPQILKGRVLASDNNEPLANVSIMAGDAISESDAAGQFTFNRLFPDTVLSVIPDARFMTTEFVFIDQAEVVVYVEPRQLTVTIVDEFSGLPVTGAKVQALESASTTNEAGVATLLRVLQQGMFSIDHPSYNTNTVAYNINQPATVSLRARAMQGVVRSKHSGQPLPDAEFIVNGEPLSLGADGSYQLANLEPPLNISVKHSGFQSAQISLATTETGLSFASKDIESRPCQIEPVTGPPLCLDLYIGPFAAKAIYIPFNLLSSPETIYDLFALVDRTELNAVILDVKGDRGELAWDSQFWRADALGIDGNRPGWMTLENFLNEAESRNIYTIARMVIFKDNPLAYGYPDLAVTQANSVVWLDGESLAWANPFRAEVHEYNIELAKEIAALGFDEINLDYIRFPSDGNLSAIAYPEENTAETRTAAIGTFAKKMNEAVKPYGVFLSADVFGLTVWVEPENDMNIGQRVIDIAPYVDYLSPMIYPSTFLPGNLGLADPSANPYQVIYQSQMEAREKTPGTTGVRPWLQAYWYNTGEMLLQKQAANDANSDGWLWWNAAGVYDEAIFELE